jgi:ATP-binding cassette subfamily B protein
VTRRNARAFYRYDVKMTPKDRERFYLLELLEGRAEAGEVRALGIAQHLSDRYDTLSAERIVGLRSVLREQLRRLIAAHVGFAAVSVIVLGLLVRAALHHDLTIASAAIAAVALQQLGSQLRTVHVALGALDECVLFLEDFALFVSAAPAAGADQAQPAEPRAFDAIALRKVSYTYPGADIPALDQVDLELLRGETIAIVGENGSGKSTLARVLSGLLKPADGTVLWDGVDASQVDQAERRAATAAVFQDFLRLQLSVADNIGLGRVARCEDREGVIAAARRAAVHNFVESLPDGYDTRLSPEYDAGVELSVGQWQRLALARALFRDAPLIVLDEPAAALDPQAERALFDTVTQLGDRRTIVLISHRLATVMRADRIVVLAHGRVVEQGSHEQLREAGGAYEAMFRFQAEPFMEQGTAPLAAPWVSNPRAETIRQPTGERPPGDVGDPLAG